VPGTVAQSRTGVVLPLDHLLVLDLTTGRSGPTAARQLGDWGARVINVERPDVEQHSFSARLTADHQNLHRNTESITLDLKTDEGRTILLALAARADVLLENYRPGVTERLGIDFATLHALNPRLVYGSISGFGQDGPYANRPGFDQIAQGLSGLMSVTGLPGQGPVRAGIAVADSSSGLYLACGVLTALVQRERTGVGRWVRTSLLESLVALMDFQAARWLVEGICPDQEGNDHPTVIPMGVFPAADGVFNIAAGGNAMWRKLCVVLGLERLVDHPAFADHASRSKHRGELNVMIAERTRTRPAAEWIDELNAAGVPAGPILTIADMWADPQMQALELAQPVEHPELGDINLVGQPLTFGDAPDDRGVRTPAPRKGRDTDDVLAELGYDQAAITDLRSRHVV
jgi:crotonobetainyl-CoA:carnitine CoA-transferase CaiB-like acyl-CoA transferase